ncbi:hypothetical protein [Chloroflexus sp.]|uniref:hypothetical protein n=1 Tax=Chloroflexus sp. TaxID=1904827 RepID=UPI0026384F61|nr:hypothetical protein [uncultured Chloroflexus sp.]
MPVRIPDGAEVLSELTAQFGQRLPTSAAEAMAAAQINARLRQAGFSVDTRPLPTVAHPGARFASVAVALLVAIALAVWHPVSGIIIGLGLMACLMVDALYTPLPVWRQSHLSQNIIAARPIEGATAERPGQPRWRMVLLAPLDTPPVWRGITRLIAPTREGLFARLTLCSLPIAIAVSATSWPVLRWMLASGALIGALVLLWTTRRPVPLMQPDGGLAALATLLVAAQQLSGLRHVEVWPVAIGAAHCSQNGISDLIKRYPFEREQTVMIGLGPLTAGQLTIMSREGVFRHEQADPLLIRLAMAADRADPVIDLEPRAQAVRNELLSPLQQRGFRVLGIRAAANGVTSLDPQLVERAARLIVAIAHTLEIESETNDDLSALRTK